jgi:hypothetical protein
MRFEVTNFGSLNGNPPPTDPVTGTIMWESAGIHDPILSIDSINMTIGGHPYSIGEITYVPPSYQDYEALIGGSASGPRTMTDRQTISGLDGIKRVHYYHMILLTRPQRHPACGTPWTGVV